MSHYVDLITQMQDEEALVRALGRMGFPRNQVEVHEKATNLYGYQADKRSQLANVIVRRKYAGSASNDLGWEKVGNNLKSHISEYDQGKYNKDWQQKLFMYYNVEKSKMACDAKKLKYTEDVDEKQKPRLRIQVPSGHRTRLAA